MSASPRLIGSSGSVFATALLFGSITLFWPAVRYCWECGSAAGGDPVAEQPLVTTWRPFIANSDIFPASADPWPACPAPQATGYRFSLDDAPLPKAFDPFGAEGPLFACVLVGGSGEVLEARLIGANAGAAPAALLRSIRHWRFTPASWDSPPPAWQRVRLDAGPGRPLVWDPPQLY